MADLIQKRFSTIETILKMLNHRELMFRAIETSDKRQGNAVIEAEFFYLVAEYKKGLSAEKQKEVTTVFDYKNLLSAKVLDDRRATDGVTKLWFNSVIIDLFRLCKISLYRPLNKTSLLSAMTPIWSILSDINEKQLSLIPGTEEYDEWTDTLNAHITGLLGRIKANITKLEQIGEQFQEDIAEEGERELPDAMKLKFEHASKLYRHEVQPLSSFLDKDTRYEKGDGILLTIDALKNVFVRNGDLEYQALMTNYYLQYLDLFEPIKAVADNISIYLRKTKEAIAQHNAIESAYVIIKQAYNKTLSADRRLKNIKLSDLQDLAPERTLGKIKRPAPIQIDKKPAFLSNVFNELARRTLQNAHSIDDKLVFEDVIQKDSAVAIRHSIRLNRWVTSHSWPVNVDFIAHAYEQLKNTFEGFKVPDLLEISSTLVTSKQYTIKALPAFKQIREEDPDTGVVTEMGYCVRHITATGQHSEGSDGNQ
ncbi:hypothetical protein V6D52_12035 [Idiomarina loihiensis]|uniref:hypothetical protein n=1 Tax=Idiomarina loihiensis TaxID=135577 RepID=UPI0039BDE5F6